MTKFREPFNGNVIDASQESPFWREAFAAIREVAELRAKVAELQADADRLDWLAAHALGCDLGRNGGYQRIALGRATIDAARGVK